MEYTFLIPTILSVVSLIWNYIQSIRILNLKSESERRNLIHKYQFEKEFFIYTDLWAKLIELRNTTASLRPAFDTLDTTKNEEEIKKERTEKQFMKLIDVVESFDKNRPFYSKEIYDKINGLIKLTRHEGIDYFYSEKKDIQYWKDSEKNIKEIVESMDNISDLIRKRIEFV